MTLQTVLGLESIAAGGSSRSSLLQPKQKQQKNKQLKQKNRCIIRLVFQVLYVLPYKEGQIFGLLILFLHSDRYFLHNKRNFQMNIQYNTIQKHAN